jgi:hypothetical protein
MGHSFLWLQQAEALLAWCLWHLSWVFTCPQCTLPKAACPVLSATFIVPFFPSNNTSAPCELCAQQLSLDEDTYSVLVSHFESSQTWPSLIRLSHHFLHLLTGMRLRSCHWCGDPTPALLNCPCVSFLFQLRKVHMSGHTSQSMVCAYPTSPWGFGERDEEALNTRLLCPLPVQKSSKQS